jgi:hypothetical protein
MSFTRQKAAGWSTNDPITPAEIEGIDENLANAFDKTGGETITGASEWRNTMTMAQSGKTSVAWRFDDATLGDADTTVTVAKDEWHFTTSPTVARTYTVRHTGTVPVAGARITVVAPFATTADAIFKREDLTEIGRIVGSGNGGSITFTYSGSAWYTSCVSGDGAFTV